AVGKAEFPSHLEGKLKFRDHNLFMEQLTKNSDVYFMIGPICYPDLENLVPGFEDRVENSY
ncbi:hypothetical protein M501DRAFT_938562, partial [Patellaria atrata CBS 101060]